MEETYSVPYAKLENSLHELAKKLDTHLLKELRRDGDSKRRFNVFSCLTRHHFEELHSKFLFYLLNPKSTHDCGSIFLNAFLTTLIRRVDVQRFISEQDVRTFTNALVRREVYIGNAKEEDVYGYIDLVIESDTVFIAIENKIWASEQPRQIERYVSYAKSTRKKVLCLFLTPRGHAAQQAGTTEYVAVSYDKDIFDWLKSCQMDYKLPHAVTVGIRYYQDLLKQSIVPNFSKPSMNHLVKALLKKENELIVKHLREIGESLVPVRNALRNQFFEGVADKLNYYGVEFRVYPDHIGASEMWNKQYQGFAIGGDQAKIKLKCGVEVRMEVQHDWESLYYGLLAYKVVDGKLMRPVSPQNMAELKEVEQQMQIAFTNKLRDIDNIWFCWQDFQVLDQDGPFDSDELNHLFLTKMESLVEDFAGRVFRYYEAWLQTCRSLSPEGHNFD